MSRNHWLPNELQQRIINRIAQGDEPTARQIADEFSIEDEQYGKYMAISRLLPELRSRGVVVDCPRCPHCWGAMSRGARNVRLRLTSRGQEFVRS